MQFVHILDHAKRRITIAPSGRLTLDDMLTNLKRRVAEGAWGYAVLYDMGDAPLPSLAEVHELAGHALTLIAQLGRCGPLAIVSRDPQADAIARAATVVANGSMVVRFFSERGAAEAWLDHRHEQSSRLRLVPGLGSKLSWRPGMNR